MSVNKVMILGHLGRDPEVRYLPNGDAIANVTIATTESWKDKATGEKRDATEWHRVSFFGKLAEIVGQYLKKGSQVYVEGSLRTRKWQDKEGVDRYTTEIRADSMQMLDKKNESAQDGGYTEQPRASATRPARQTSKPNQNQNQNHQTHNGFDDMDDDIPF